MSKPHVLLMNTLMPHVIETLERDYVLHRYDRTDEPDKLVSEVGGEVKAIAAMGHAQVDAALMERLPKLEIVALNSVGYDGTDVAAATARGVRVTHTPNVLNDEVANTAIMLLLAATRRLVAYDLYTREGRWEREGDPPLTRGLRGKTVGILGLGRIGKAIAEKLAVFGPEIVYHGRTEQADQPYRYYADLVEMAKACDAIVIITPGGKGTEKIVDADVLEALGPEGTLVNVARGSVVDEAALVKALEEGKLGAAGLDVFEDEPRVPDVLKRMTDRVVLQPHQGSATVETRRAMGDLVVENLEAHFAGKPLATPVN